jgi:hypothetical protein
MLDFYITTSLSAFTSRQACLQRLETQRSSNHSILNVWSSTRASTEAQRNVQIGDPSFSKFWSNGRNSFSLLSGRRSAYLCCPASSFLEKESARSRRTIAAAGLRVDCSLLASTVWGGSRLLAAGLDGLLLACAGLVACCGPWLPVLAAGLACSHARCWPWRLLLHSKKWVTWNLHDELFANVAWGAGWKVLQLWLPAPSWCCSKKLDICMNYFPLNIYFLNLFWYLF